MWFRVFFLSLALVGLASFAFARDVTLQWDPNTEPDIAGYKIYYNPDSSELPFTGTGAAEGASPVDVKNVTTATLTGLDPSRAYYFAVTAYDVDGYESSFSNIVSAPEALPPAVSIDSPEAGSSLSGLVTVSGTATDNVKVTTIEVFLDGLSVATPASSPFSASVDVSAVSPGSHTIKVVATDSAGNAGEAAVTFTVVNDFENPSAVCTAPASGSTISKHVLLAAQATDNLGIQRVEFFVNGVSVGTDTTAPYEITWNSRDVANGPATIVVRAYDVSARWTESAPVTVSVDNDKKAPEIVFSNRGGEQALKGTVSITATATDNVGVTKVEWYLDGALKAEQTVPPYTYTWKTGNVLDGSHTVAALAYDAENNIGSTGVLGTVISNLPPIVRISSPANGWKYKKTLAGGAVPEGVTVLAENKVVPVTVEASSAAGISKVDFYVNGKPAGTKTSAPYTFDWNTETVNGTRILAARAYDALGRSTTSAKVTVLVSDDVIPPVVKISPKEGRYVTGVTKVKVLAKDKSGIAEVKLYIDDVFVAGGTKTALVYKWNTSTYSPAENHVLKVVATDRLGNTTESISNVKVKDLEPPDLAEPLVQAGQQVTISASATDNVGVARMVIAIDGKAVAESQTGTISYTWDTTTVKAGKHAIAVAAYDAAGKVVRKVVPWEK